MLEGSIEVSKSILSDRSRQQSHYSTVSYTRGTSKGKGSVSIPKAVLLDSPTNTETSEAGPGLGRQSG